jgi:hypothetical protein
MRYYTRQLYKSLQQPPYPSDDAERRWHEAVAAYHAELLAIKPQLPPSMRAFADVTLHDGVVKSAERPTPDRVELSVDAGNNPWGPRGLFRVAFGGVSEVEGLAEVVGDEWLYVEVHLHPEGGFDYCVLLWKSEFRVVADEVMFEPLADTGSSSP